MAKILIIVTSAGEYAKAGYRTGLWLGELSHFTDVVEQAGHETTIASIAGGRVPIDPESLAHDVLADGGTAERYADREYMDRLEDTVAVSEVSADDYDAIYLTGGHGVMFDFDDESLAKLISDFDARGKIVSAVCHGPAGLLQARRADGEYVISGRDVTGFSWPEEESAQRADVVPYRLEDELADRGARYSKADDQFVEHVVTDKTLITGQNPQSAHGVARAVVDALA